MNEIYGFLNEFMAEFVNECIDEKSYGTQYLLQLTLNSAETMRFHPPIRMRRGWHRNRNHTKSDNV